MDEKENFEEYMTDFRKKALKEKQSIIFEQLKYISSMTNTFCNELNIDNEPLLTKDVLKINNDDYSEDDFANALIVLINSIQESVCDYVLGVDKLIDPLVENVKDE